MLQPSLEHTTSFDVDAPPTSSTGTLRSGASLLERMKGLFSMARAPGNGHPPDPGLHGDQKDAAGANSMSAGASSRREEISLEQRPSGDDHVHMVVDMLGTHEVEAELWSGDDLPRGWFSWRKLWRFTGPGFLMSIGYIDPGNLEGDLQAGANTGYTLLWLLVWSTAMGFILQRLAAKLGVATGRHLAQHCRDEYPPVPRILMWLMIEIAIIGCDIQEVIGSAIAISLLSKGAIPLWAGVLITAVDSFLLLLIERCGLRNLEALFGVLVGIMAISFGIMFVDAGVPAGQVAEGLVLPRLPASSVHFAVAIVGAIIMPHNIYLHSALVQSRKINTAQPARKKEAVAYFSIESAIALVISLFINICVVAVFARGFFGKGIEDIGLQNAGEYLGTAFGKHMELVWAVGLLAAGQSSTMTGTYSGQFVMSGFLDLGVTQWQRVAVTRSVAIAPTLVVALLFRGGGNQLDVLNEWINVLQCIQLPFALIPLLTMTSSERIMGKPFVNTTASQVVGWCIAAGVMAVNASDIWDFASGALGQRPSLIAPFTLGVILYLAFVAYLVIGPERMQSWQQRWHPQPESVKAEQDLDPLLESVVPQGDSRLSTASSQSSLHAN